MKIGYIIYPEAVVVGAGNGIRAQALKWCQLLRERGHEVVLINPWESYRWSEFDLIHVFRGFNDLDWYHQLASRNPNIIFSPIWDSNMSIRKLRFLRRLALPGMYSPLRIYGQHLQCFKGVLARSRYEASVMRDAFDVSNERIEIVPIGYEIEEGENVRTNRDSFCLHVSTLYQERKNVVRLIAAAKKYDFKLVLAGSHGTERDFAPIANAAHGCHNIEIKGFLSNEELAELYKRAKVFALPSIEEGVGLVALNAGLLGADVVITDRGGPKEYFGEHAWVVNPYDVDAIGGSIVSALSRTKQPMLRSHIIKEYSPDAIADKLITSYVSIIER